jgi:hypothetical protein
VVVAAGSRAHWLVEAQLKTLGDVALLLNAVDELKGTVEGAYAVDSELRARLAEVEFWQSERDRLEREQLELEREDRGPERLARLNRQLEQEDSYLAPRCAALTRQDQRCRNSVVSGGLFCQRHTDAREG